VKSEELTAFMDLCSRTQDVMPLTRCLLQAAGTKHGELRALKGERKERGKRRCLPG